MTLYYFKCIKRYNSDVYLKISTNKAEIYQERVRRLKAGYKCDSISESNASIKTFIF